MKERVGNFFPVSRKLCTFNRGNRMTKTNEQNHNGRKITYDKVLICQAFIVSWFYLYIHTYFSSVHSVVSSSLWPHGLQHTRLPCPSATPGTCSNSCPSSRWCHPAILSCRPLLLLPSIFPNIRVFSNESVLHIRWPKYWSFSFSISPSNENPGLISFRIDWFGLYYIYMHLLEKSDPLIGHVI